MPSYMSMASDRYLTPADLVEFIPDVSTTKLQAMIDDVFAVILSIAPNVDTFGENVPLTNIQVALVTSILRQAVISYEKSDGGNVATEQEVAGPFTHMTTVDSRQYRKGLLTGNQVEQLKGLQETLSGVVTQAKVVEVDLLSPNWGIATSMWGV